MSRTPTYSAALIIEDTEDEGLHCKLVYGPDEDQDYISTSKAHRLAGQLMAMIDKGAQRAKGGDDV